MRSVHEARRVDTLTRSGQRVVSAFQAFSVQRSTDRGLRPRQGICQPCRAFIADLHFSSASIALAQRAEHPPGSRQFENPPAAVGQNETSSEESSENGHFRGREEIQFVIFNHETPARQCGVQGRWMLPWEIMMKNAFCSIALLLMIASLAEGADRPSILRRILQRISPEIQRIRC